MTWARGGFLGVDAFFVLSGYLITTLLLTEWQRTGRIAMLAFWARRARRLLPAVLLMVLTVTLTARYLVPVEERRDLAGDGLAALFYVANWRMVLRGGDYFADTAGPSPLEHTWSLGVEEQFYLLCPVVLALVLLVTGRPLRVLLALAVLGAAASTLALALLYDPFDPGRSYYGTDTRASSLLVGLALAVALSAAASARSGPSSGAIQRVARPARSVCGAIALLGAVFLGWAWTHATGDDGWLYHGGLLLAALSVAAVLAHLALSPDGLASRMLTVPPLPGLGLVSYGVYLWHWPVFLVVDGRTTGLIGTRLWLVRCGITIAIAVASYTLVEQPIRHARRLQPGPATFAAAASAVMVVAVLPFAPWPAASRMPAPGADLTEARPAGGLERLLTDRTAGAPAPPLHRSRDPNRPRGAAVPAPRHWRPGTRLVVDVFGDSLPWSLVTALPAHHGIDVRDRTILGCGIVLSTPYQYFGHSYPHVYRVCRGWSGHWRQALTHDRPHLAVVMVGRWETMTRTFHGRWRALGDPVYDRYLRQRLHHAITVAGSTGARVVLATLPYNRRGERPDGGLFPEDAPARVTAWNRLLRDVAADHPGVAVLDIGHRITPEDRYTATAGGYPMRTDGLHLAPDGVRHWVAPWLYPRLVRLASSAAAPTRSATATR
jgi:peptidoglycan/LPS O-acetylase OafA/YrhL